MKRIRLSLKILVVLAVVALLSAGSDGLFFGTTTVYAEPTTSMIDGILSGEEELLAPAMQLLILLVVVTLAPTLLLMMTGFTRIIIILHFMRNAIGTQQMPPNQVLLGLALFLTLFMMGPQLAQINEYAWGPYTRGEITQEEALQLGFEPLRDFMVNQLRVNEVDLFARLAGQTFETADEMPASVLIPAFIVSELTTAFMFGFFIFLPFVAMDMVVASILMAMGMMMLPPAMISLPFKVLLFVLAGGWTFVLETIMLTFMGGG